MFGRIYKHRLLTVLCGLVFFSLSNNTIFWTFCPHLSARSQHCLTRETFSSSHFNANPGTMSHEHSGDMEMSNMDEEELPFETSTTREAETGNLSDIKSFPGFDPLLTASVTDPQGSCPHCMMQPQSGANSPSAPIVLNNFASHGIVAVASSNMSASLVSPVSFVDVHDHSPPGLKGSRYILISTFRI